MSVKQLLFGKPIPDDAAEAQRIGVMPAVSALGLDALASAAYGPEAALTVLIAVGATGSRVLLPLIAGALVLLWFVQFSYRQAAEVYPDGGGSYSVARSNLGKSAGLLAASALSLDYILNVAVAISAGVGALVSAVPSLLGYTVPLCLGLLGLMTLINLRGVRSAGVAFMAPTWLFVIALGVTIAVGAVKYFAADGHPSPVVPPPHAPELAAPLTVWLAIRAFSAGCTSITGVEAVSNAVPDFREPRQRNARRTLTSVTLMLAVLLAGVAALTSAYGIRATAPGEPGYGSVLSEIIAAVMGRGVFYYAAVSSIVAVLCLSANTSFVDFPGLWRVLAHDRFLPEAFAHAGRRLVHASGIILLSALAAGLIVLFHGKTDLLIPLFAIGAFLSFTLCQVGMALYWRKRGGVLARRSMWINLIGAAGTSFALVVIAVARFFEGAWLALLFVPALLLLFRGTHRHYARVARAAAITEPLALAMAPTPPLVVVPVKHLDRVTEKALRFALSISSEVHAVQIRSGEMVIEEFDASWRVMVEAPLREAGLPAPSLVILWSEYRQLVDPLLRYIRRVSRQNPDRFVAVLVPELIERRWYHYLLHSHTATLLKMMVLFRGGPQVVVINAPWYSRATA